MPARPEYWVGYFATTIAEVHRHDPNPTLKTALRDFLKERPAGDPLGDRLRDTLKQKGN